MISPDSLQISAKKIEKKKTNSNAGHFSSFHSRFTTLSFPVSVSDSTLFAIAQNRRRGSAFLLGQTQQWPLGDSDPQTERTRKIPDHGFCIFVLFLFIWRSRLDTRSMVCVTSHSLLTSNCSLGRAAEGEERGRRGKTQKTFFFLLSLWTLPVQLERPPQKTSFHRESFCSTELFLSFFSFWWKNTTQHISRVERKRNETQIDTSRSQCFFSSHAHQLDIPFRAFFDLKPIWPRTHQYFSLFFPS